MIQDKAIVTSDVVLGLEANFYGLGLGTCGLGLGLEGPGLGFESCINNFLPLPSNSRPDYYY